MAEQMRIQQSAGTVDPGVKGHAEAATGDRGGDHGSSKLKDIHLESIRGYQGSDISPQFVGNTQAVFMLCDSSQKRVKGRVHRRKE